eukprot:3875272-Rhodomonas_salina.1
MSRAEDDKEDEGDEEDEEDLRHQRPCGPHRTLAPVSFFALSVASLALAAGGAVTRAREG